MTERFNRYKEQQNRDDLYCKTKMLTQVTEILKMILESVSVILGQPKHESKIDEF